jgi:hypothetical protein
LVPDEASTAHPYIGASPGCWSIFTQILTRDYESYHPAIHQLIVDTYCAQHPGTPSPQSVSSVAIHLLGLYLAVEKGFPPQKMLKAKKIAAKKKYIFSWLLPPKNLGVMTLLDLSEAQDIESYNHIARQWATCVWESWAEYHPTVRQWYNALCND